MRAILKFSIFPLFEESHLPIGAKLIEKENMYKRTIKIIKRNKNSSFGLWQNMHSAKRKKVCQNHKKLKKILECDRDWYFQNASHTHVTFTNTNTFRRLLIQQTKKIFYI